MINEVTLVGYLGKSPEFRKTQNGTLVCDLNLATDASYRDKDGNKVPGTDWHTVQTWRDEAQRCNQYLHKGSLVYVKGRIRYQRWTDGVGEPHSRTVIQAFQIRFLDRAPAGNTSNTPIDEAVAGISEEGLEHVPEAWPPTGSESDDIPF